MIEDTRKYGGAPCRAAVVHGGPGAAGSCAGFARELAARCGVGVLEALQTEYSVAGQREELKRQISGGSPPVLIGHSWGAWLAASVAEKNPETVEKLVLVGTPPLAGRHNIDEVRRQRFTPAMREEFSRLLPRLETASSPDEKNRLFGKLGSLCSRADAYAPLDVPEDPAEMFDGEMFEKVWAEGSAMRESGAVARIFRNLKVPLVIIHGDFDPHPAEGVRSVLADFGVPFEFHLLERCGHTPWREKYAAEPFFELLKRVIAR